MSENPEAGTVAGHPPAKQNESTILMESATIGLPGGGCGECRVSRGMATISADGEEVGRVAAVVLDAAGESTGVVLARWQKSLDYCLLPLSLIDGVSSGKVRLRIPAEVARSLPARNGGPAPADAGSVE